MNRKTFLAALTAMCTIGLMAQMPPPPPGQVPPPPPGPGGRMPPPGMRWCSKCGGDGYNRTWYGWAKKCHVCDGTGLLRLEPPPPPPRHMNGGHHDPHMKGGPAPKPAPHKNVKAPPKGGPAPKPAPNKGVKAPPKGGHMPPPKGGPDRR